MTDKDKRKSYKFAPADFRENAPGGRKKFAERANRAADKSAHEAQPLSKATAHLNKETERGEHSPAVGGHTDHNHGGKALEQAIKMHNHLVKISENEPDSVFHKR